ncbi:MAG: hypothetical protein NTW86_27060 [Candidatus Sumerlaeota bacterium]|nr:hypothetical protein [Candidatus Sumerlaeota bacterium]
MVFVEAKVLDATHLELSSPIAAPSGRIVLVTVAEAEPADDERREWLAFSAQSLQSAYGPSEPDYTADMIRESNPEYGK